MSGTSFDQLVHALGQHIGTTLGSALVDGLMSSVGQAKLLPAVSANASKAAKLPAKASAAVPAGKGCRVPRCVRRSATHGLCRSHYGKARRLNMKMDSLGNAELATLAIDGRSDRAGSKPAPRPAPKAKIASKGRGKGKK